MFRLFPDMKLTLRGWISSLWSNCLWVQWVPYFSTIADFWSVLWGDHNGALWVKVTPLSRVAHKKLAENMQSQSSIIASAISVMLQSHRENSGWRPLNSPNCCNHGDVLSISLAVKWLFQRWGPGLDTRCLQSDKTATERSQSNISLPVWDWMGSRWQLPAHCLW